MSRCSERFGKVAERQIRRESTDISARLARQGKARVITGGSGKAQISANQTASDQELQFAESTDINWSENALRVHSKLKWGFMSKSWGQRDMPLFEELPDELREWRDKHPGRSVILSNSRGNPASKLLCSLKRLARRAKLKCGRCEGCKDKNRELRQFTLHKLRMAFIAAMLRMRYDLRTVQAWADHRESLEAD